MICPDMTQTKRENKLFIFSQNLNKKELKIKKRRQFAMASLQWLWYNDFVAMASKYN